MDGEENVAGAGVVVPAAVASTSSSSCSSTIHSCSRNCTLSTQGLYEHELLTLTTTTTGRGTTTTTTRSRSVCHIRTRWNPAHPSRRYSSLLASVSGLTPTPRLAGLAPEVTTLTTPPATAAAGHTGSGCGLTETGSGLSGTGNGTGSGLTALTGAGTLDSDSPPRLDIETIPIELKLLIFECLDAKTLYTASKVCQSWRDLIVNTVKFTTNLKWLVIPRFASKFLRYNPSGVSRGQAVDQMVYEDFAKLMNGINCWPCFLEEKAPDDAPHCSIVTRRMKNEMKDLPGPGVHAMPVGEINLFRFIGMIQGPPDSPYENGVFFLRIFIPPMYPLEPPDVRFLTKVLHPNIDCHGHIDINIFSSGNYGWQHSLKMDTILLSLQSLLTDPFVERGCGDRVLGKMYRENRPEYDRLAKEWTLKYATSPPPLPPRPPPESLLKSYQARRNTRKFRR